MTILRTAERWAFAATVLSVLAYAVADADMVVFVIGVPAAITAWLITRGSASRPLPRAVINLLLFVAVAWGTLSLFSEGLGVSLFSEFVAALLVIKLLDRRGCRDTAQILTLSAFLVIGAILTSNSFWLGIVTIGYLPTLIAGVLWYQLARVDEAAGLAATPSEPARRPVFRRVSLVMLTSIVIASAVFVLMPREIGSRTIGSWGSPSVGQVVGFNDEVRLGVGGLISESPEPVLDLQLYDRDEVPVGAIGQRFYLRGAVLDEYDLPTGTWTRSESSRNDFDFGPAPQIRPRMTPVTGGIRVRDWTLRQEVTIRNIATERGHLFSVWQVTSVRVDPPARLQFARTDGSLRVQGHSGKVSYTAYSHDRTRPPPRWEEPTEEERAALAEIGQDLPEAARIAREVLTADGIDPDPLGRSAAMDAAAVASLRNHFTAGGYRYTLETVSSPPGRDPIEWFLTDAREGHCEYYASALAVMCRAVGIDARVITGYVATDYNPATESYIVRASNAHAWVEAEVLPGYWRTFDPTPSADLTRIHAPPQGLLADARRFVDTLEFAWIRAVVGYDADTRSTILGPAGADPSVFPALERIGSTIEHARRVAPEALLEAGRNALVTFCVTVIGASIVLRERRRIWAFLWWVLALLLSPLLGTRHAPPSPADTLHGRLLEAYRRAGHAKPDWVPLRTHTARLAEGGVFDTETGTRAARLTDRLYAAYFAGEPLGGDALRDAASELDSIRAWARSAGSKRAADGRRDPDAEP